MKFDFLSNGREMGALMRAKDWSSTPLGLPDQWPEILKTSLRLILTSNYPMFIWWSSDLVQFYNDAYRRTMGPERHPSALGQPGRECWGEIWDIIGPQIDSVMAGGPATWHEDQLVPVTRHGQREDVWWTLVKSLVTLHGGRVTASSEGTGKGAVFTLYLPAFDAAMDDGSYHDQGVNSPTQAESLRLLVVDDNVDAANALAMFLEAAGHQVTVEHGPIAALEQVKTAAYDVFLLDIGLPDMDGNELARRLRLIPKVAHATLIAVTGYGKQYDKETSIAAGFDYYFVKPASPAKLVEILSRIKPL